MLSEDQQLLSRIQDNMRYIVLAIIAVILFVLIICPLGAIFATALFQDGKLNIAGAIDVVVQSENAQMIANSLFLGALVVIVSTLIATPLAYLFSRTRFAKYKIFDIIFMIPFMTPPFIASMGWILFMQKRGLLQQMFPMFKGSEDFFFSIAGLVIVMSLHSFPFMFTLLKNAMLNIPSSLEESAQVFGAGFGQRLRKIFFPLLTSNYAIGALLIFVKTLSEYGTPATLGVRIGFDVFTTQIHRYATVAPVHFGNAAALSSVLIGICVVMWLLQNYISNRKSYNLVSGKGSRFKFEELSKLALVVAWIYIIVTIFFSIIVPFFAIISTSLINLRGLGLALGNFTFQHYIDLFTSNSKGIGAIINSLILAVAAASICAVLGTIIVVVIRKIRPKALGTLTEGVSLLPSFLPSIVMVLGIMIFWNALYDVAPLYNTLGILVLAYVVLYLPYTIQYVTSAAGQISDSLQDAARVFGAKPLYILRRVVFPLIKPGILTAWIMTFIISFRELVTASLIAPPNVLVVSTFIVREFEQGSVSVGMAMAVICVAFTTISLTLLNKAVDKQKVAD